VTKTRISSRTLATELGKSHPNVIKRIKTLYSEGNCLFSYKEGYYIGGNKRRYKTVEVSEEAAQAFREIRTRWDIVGIKVWEKKEEKPFHLISREYVNSKTPLWWRCPECGKPWKSTLDSVMFSESTCLNCCHQIPWTFEAVNRYMFRNFDSFIFIGLEEESFKTVDTPMKWRCHHDHCNHVWKATWQHIKNGSSCPECYKRDRLGWYTSKRAEENKEAWLTIPAEVYFLECWNEDQTERFYKIGITKNNVK
jgi:rubrerythrin